MKALHNLDDPYLSPSSRNPFAALLRLGNAITAIDRFLAAPACEILEVTIHRRLAYLRNTLAVSHELWQSDVHRRVNRSRQGFYIFCMTDREKQGFQRRMIPALDFAAGEMRALAIKTLEHVADLVESCSREAGSYVNHNKAAIRAGMGADDDQTWRVFTPLRLPSIEPGM